MLIKIKEGHQLDGEGEGIGTDETGKSHTFWRMSGHMDVPADLAIKLENERPQRYEIVDREYVKKLGIKPEYTPRKRGVPPNPIVPNPYPGKNAENRMRVLPENKITIQYLEDLTKDKINDTAARWGYDVNTSDKKAMMIRSLVKQIKNKTGIKVPKE